MTDYFKQQSKRAHALLLFVHLHGAPSQSTRQHFFKDMRRYLARTGHVMSYSQGWCVIAPLFGQSLQRSRHDVCNWLLDHDFDLTAETYFPVDFRTLLTTKNYLCPREPNDPFPAYVQESLSSGASENKLPNEESAERVRRVTEGLLLNALSWFQYLVSDLKEVDHA